MSNSNITCDCKLESWPSKSPKKLMFPRDRCSKRKLYLPWPKAAPSFGERVSFAVAVGDVGQGDLVDAGEGSGPG